MSERVTEPRWLEPIIAPSRLIWEAQRAPDPGPQVGLAVLLDLQLTLYDLVAEKSGLPKFGDAVSEDAPPEHQLLAGVARDLAGEGDGRESLQTLVSSVAPSELGLVAAVLAGIGFARADEPQTAADILHQQLATMTGSLERTLVQLHLGVRAAIEGDFGEAVRWTREARAVVEESNEWGYALWVIASWNLCAFERRLPPADRTVGYEELPVRATCSILNRADILLASGLGNHLEREFDISLRSPYHRGFHWEAQDPVERGVLAALTRAECLADWNDIGVARKALGRYRILAGVGRDEEPLESAFDLLRLAGDSKALSLSARIVARLGPLETLRRVAASSVTAAWTPLDQAARLAILTEAADLLEPSEAAEALNRVLEPVLLLHEIDGATKAVAALLPVAPPEVQTSASERLRTIAADHPNTVVLQSLARSVMKISWDAVESGERATWLEYVSAHLAERSDHGLLAQAVAVSLGATEPDAIRTCVGDAFAADPRLDTLEVFLHDDAPIPVDAAARGLEIARESLKRVRESAAKGTYSLGGLNVSLLTFLLLQRVRSDEAWSELTDFLLDPAVDITEKTATLNAMAHSATDVDSATAQRLQSELAELTGWFNELGATEDELRAAAVRLAVKLGAASPRSVLNELLRLAGSLKPSARIQAARTLARVIGLIDASAVVTLALQLTDDRDPEVRAAAARSLAVLFADASDPFSAATHERLLRLLRDPGSLVPQATVAGLYDAYHAGRLPPPALVAAVSDLRDHLSRGVRLAAETFLREIAEHEP